MVLQLSLFSNSNVNSSSELVLLIFLIMGLIFYFLIYLVIFVLMINTVSFHLLGGGQLLLLIFVTCVLGEV